MMMIAFEAIDVQQASNNFLRGKRETEREGERDAYLPTVMY